jgi:hypothetical protein
MVGKGGEEELPTKYEEGIKARHEQAHLYYPI